MPEQVPRSVYDSTIGADGGGRAGGDPLPAIDPDNPVNNVNELVQDGPEHWTGSDPALTALAGDTGWTDLGDALRACPTCGTGVHPDRIRD